MSEENNNDDDNGDFSSSVLTKIKTKTKKPSMYKVLMLNDDYTPMDFVVHVLQKFFKKAEPEALRIMLQVHQQGVGICGVFSFELAESKVHQVVDYARKYEHPLQCTLEKE
jgi:ATP-dependent Clp protease adaptor protein ClpS